MLRTPFHHLSSVGVEEVDGEKHLPASPVKTVHPVDGLIDHNLPVDDEGWREIRGGEAQIERVGGRAGWFGNSSGHSKDACPKSECSNRRDLTSFSILMMHDWYGRCSANIAQLSAIFCQA
jgi:hypothetical protein